MAGTSETGPTVCAASRTTFLLSALGACPESSDISHFHAPSPWGMGYLKTPHTTPVSAHGQGTTKPHRKHQMQNDPHARAVEESIALPEAKPRIGGSLDH